jgi:hypothetical protein
VGRHEGFDEPTILTTSQPGSITLDHVNWVPDWLDWRGQPLPRRAKQVMSSVFARLTPPLPARDMHIELKPLACRNPVRIEQQPCAANNYTLILEFNDTDLGATWYKLRVTVR